VKVNPREAAIAFLAAGLAFAITFLALHWGWL